MKKKVTALLLSFSLMICLLATLVPAQAADAAKDLPVTEEQLDAIRSALSQIDLPELSDLTEQLGELDMAELVSELKDILADTASMTDKELGREIRAIAEEHDIHLNDEQVRQLTVLCRKLEKLSDKDLQDTVEKLRAPLEKIREAGEKVQQAAGAAKGFFQKVRGFADRARNFFSGLFGK